MTTPKTDEEKAKWAEKMLTSLSELREPFEGEVDNIITYVVHGRRRIRDKKRQKGKRTGVETYSSTALEALNILVDGLCGYTMSRSFRWFSYMIPARMNFGRASRLRGWAGKRLDEFPDVRDWLSDFEEVMYSAFLKSNVYDKVGDVVRDAASIGTVSPILEEELAEERFVLQVPHFRECFLAENRFGVVDTCYRVYDLSLRQLKDKFGQEKMVSVWPDFTHRIERNPFEEVEVLHAIYPRKDFFPGRLDRAALPIASCWFLRAPSKMLEESGYPESPSFSWRWRKNNDELFGRSPIWDAMVEVMMGNQQGRTNLVGAHKMAEPPMAGLEDLRGKVQKGASGWTSLSSMDDMPKPLFQGLQIPFSVEMQDRVDKKIRGHLQTDFFMLLSQAALQKVELTATQVLEMSGEKAAVLAARVGQMESEFMNPLHSRAVSIEWRARRIPFPPQVLLDLWDGKWDIEYLGPFSQIQKRLYKTKGIRAGIEALGMLAQAFPEVRYVIDPMKTARDLLESVGFPVKDLRSEELVAELIEQENQAQGMVEQGPVLAKLMKAIPGLGKGIDKGSMLQKLLARGEEGGEVEDEQEMVAQ